MIFTFISKEMLGLMKIFERKPGSSRSLRVLGAATQPGSSPLTEPHQALPAALRCPRAPKGSNRLCRHHSHWPGSQGIGRQNQKESLRGSLGTAKDPGFLSSLVGQGPLPGTPTVLKSLQGQEKRPGSRLR